MRLRAETAHEPTDRPNIRLTVEDTGVGIAADQLRYIFDPFWQAESTATRRFGGAGLGLSVAREFCRLLGGDLTASSEVGVGSTFTVSLPLVAADAPAAETAAGDESGEGDGAP